MLCCAPVPHSLPSISSAGKVVDAANRHMIQRVRLWWTVDGGRWTVDSIQRLADSIRSDLEQRLPSQRKTQRGKLSLLVATMLDVRSANLMDLAAGLPIEADRTDMRYQWITRFLGNPLVLSDTVMEPFAREVLAQVAGDGKPVVLILDQSKVSDRHQGLML